MRNVLLIGASVSVLNCSARAAPLLPSQEDPNVFTAKICQDREVISSIASAIDALLKTKTIIAKGMQADDIHLEAVYADEHVVYCSVTIQAKNIVETVTYSIGPKDGSYLIAFGGNKGSRLFPDELILTPIR